MNFPQRYIRQIQLKGFGAAAQQKLRVAKVLVVGAGGLGVPVLQYLTGMGIGTIGIVDGDTIGLSNLHRQVLYNEAEVGSLKAEVAVTKLSAINTEAVFMVYPELLTVDNALNIIKDFDLVIDATDNFATRYLINDACVILNKPFVYGAIQQYEGHVSVFNYLDGPTYRCLYPTPPSAGQVPDCNEAGVLGITPGIIGCQQALQAVKVITGIGKTLSGYLQIFDLLNDDQYKIKLKAKPQNKQIKSLQASYEPVVCATGGSISAEELLAWYRSGTSFALIDVREPYEFEDEHLQDAQLVPLATVESININSQVPVVTVCQKGTRSLKAAGLLSQKYPNLTVYSLEGGMDAWNEEIGDELVIKYLL
jgi:adenylyltransferase/sulfurtransferase